jgi:hypothetical protein
MRVAYRKVSGSPCFDQNSLGRASPVGIGYLRRELMFNTKFLGFPVNAGLAVTK